MTYHGKVKDGVVVLETGVRLPEGADVQVELKPLPTEPPTWAEVFKEVIGKAEGLPADSSRNHDYYLYGGPKR